MLSVVSRSGVHFSFEHPFFAWSIGRTSKIARLERNLSTPALEDSPLPLYAFVRFLTYSLYEKTILGFFVHLQSYNDKSEFSFLQTVQSSRNVLFASDPFFCKMLASFFSSYIPLWIENNPVEKLYKVLEMKRKTYMPVGPKFAFEKIKFNVLHYIQNNFLRQRPGLSKVQASMFKSLVIN